MSEPHILFKIGDGDEFDPTDQIQGLHYLGEDETVTSPQFTNTYQDFTGTDGTMLVAQTMAKRTFTERFWLEFGSYYDLQLAKTELYRIFGQRDRVRVRSDHSPDKIYYGYITPFEIAPMSNGSHDANFNMVFDVPSGVKQSLYRSDQLPSGFQFGQSIPTGELPSYHFTAKQFTVYNPSDIKVDPYYQRHDLRIICKYSGSSLTVTNKTTNESWTYKRNNGGNSTVILDGTNVYFDGTNDNVNSDGGTISLARGKNEFTVSGANAVDITVSFPFLYLL